MPPLVRRRPLIERIQSYLDPNDFLLWLSEELNDDSFQALLDRWVYTAGVALNVIFIVLRGASKPRSSADDDIFAVETSNRGGWFTWSVFFQCSILLYLITALCLFNAYLVVSRRRRYRLFEQPLDVQPTSSAYKVRLGEDNNDRAPWEVVLDLLARMTGQMRKEEADMVWEVSMWDPKPYQLTFFSLLSPGHLLLYYTVLPASPLHPRPSLTALFALCSGAALTSHLIFLKHSFESQLRDKAVVQGQVLNEYDIKYVRPTLNHLVRDVGVQTRETSVLRSQGSFVREVDVYTPTGRATRRVSSQQTNLLQENPSPITTVQDRAVPTARRRSLFNKAGQKSSRSAGLVDFS